MTEINNSFNIMYKSGYSSQPANTVTKPTEYYEIYKKQQLKGIKLAERSKDGDRLTLTLDGIEAYNRAKINNDLTRKKSTVHSKYKLSPDAVRKGTAYLTSGESAVTSDIVAKLANEVFVCIPDKESALDIFKHQYSDIKSSKDSGVFVLNPSDAAKSEHKNIGTSNIYMSEWYKEANNISNNILTRENIQEEINNCEASEITVIVPDDCAITGRSMITDTMHALNDIDIPEGKTINLVFSPMIASPTAQGAFNALRTFDREGLTKSRAFNERDNKVIDEFFKKYKDGMNISVAKGIIPAVPYYKSDFFRQLQLVSPKSARTVEAVITRNGTAAGFGRPGTSGVMIATPKEDGVTLKCPNNNVYGAVPYALAQGARPGTIKQPGKQIDGERMSPAKWQHVLTEMQKEIDNINV